jgi:hypothetical protein
MNVGCVWQRSVKNRLHFSYLNLSNDAFEVYTEANEVMTVNDVLASICEEQVEVYLKILSQYFSRGTNENHAALEL